MKKNILLMLLFTLTTQFSDASAMEHRKRKEAEESKEDIDDASTDAKRRRLDKIILGQRPQIVQDAVDKAFEENLKATPRSWHYAGYLSGYRLLRLDDDLLLTHLVNTHPKEDLYIIDIGGARGGWGKHAMSLLTSSSFFLNRMLNPGRLIHIFSITGGHECDNEIIGSKNVILHMINQFKIENLDEELLKRGFDLKNKVHLIVSNWTLRHLVDPFGTLKRMYSLLTPDEGMLLANGFLFACDGTEEIQPTTNTNWDIIASSNAISLFRHWDNGRDAGQFLLMRNSDHELDLPLEYTGKIRKLDGEWQCASEVVTEFRKGNILPVKHLWLRSLADEDVNNEFTQAFGHLLFCDANNEASKKLHAKLKQLGLFYNPVTQHKSCVMM